MEFVGKQLSPHLLKCHRDYLKLEYAVGAGGKGSLKQFGWKFTPVETLSASPRFECLLSAGPEAELLGKDYRPVCPSEPVSLIRTEEENCPSAPQGSALG